MSENKYKELDLRSVLGEPFPDEPELKLDNAMRQGMATPVEQGAKINQLSRETGVPADTVERNTADLELENRYRQLDLKKIITDSPTTAEHLSNVDNARAAHADIETLSRAEIALRNREFKDDTNWGERTSARFKEGWANLNNAIANLSRFGDIERGAQAEAFDDYIMGYDPGGNPIWMSQSVLRKKDRDLLVGATADTGRNQSQLLARDAAAHRASIQSLPRRPATEAMLEAETFGDMWDAFTVDPIGIIGDIGITSGVQQMPALAATVATRNPGIAMAAAGGNSYALELGHGVTAYLGSVGVDVTDPDAVVLALSNEATVRRALAYANVRGTVVGGFDAASGGVASKMLVPDAVISSKPVREALNTFVAQPVVQGLMGVAGEGGAQIATEGEITSVGELGAEFIGEFSHAPIEATAFAYERYRSTRADAKRLDEVTEAGKDAKLREIDPDAARALFERMGIDADAEVVYLDPDAASTFFQGDFEQEFLENPAVMAVIDDLPAALEAGRDIEIPVSDYLLDLLDTPMDDLRPHMRMDPEVLTPAQLIDEDVQAQITTLQEMDQAELEAEATVYNDILGQLLPLTEDRATAETYAMSWEAFFRAQAERPGVKALGMTAMDLYERYSPAVGREIDPGVQQRAAAISELEIMLDRLRSADVPRETDIFGTSVVPFILERGGITDEGGELAARDFDVGRVAGQRIARREGGLTSLDHAAEILAEARYIEGRDEQLVLDAIEREIGGEPVFAMGGENQELQEVRQTMLELDEILEIAGIDVLTQSNEEIIAALEATVGQDPFTQIAPDQFEVDESGDGTQFVIRATDEDTDIGRMQVEKRGEDRMQIVEVGLSPDRRGEGIGQQFIQQAYELAQSKGRTLESDVAVSALQLRVYEALKRKGWTIEYAEPELVAERLQLASDAQAAGKPIAAIGIGSTVAEQPVVTTIEPPANDLSTTQQFAALALSQDELAGGRAAALVDSATGAFPKIGERAVTESEEFKTWFGDSKVVDENGEPVVVYHATTQPGIESFETPTYFSPESQFSERFTGREGRQVYPVYLSVQNPYIIDAEEAGRHFEWDAEDVAEMKTEGYDGVWVKSDEVEDIWTVFDPEQIKSSTGNQGTFDPDSPNILFQQDLGLYSAVSKAVESMPLPEWKRGKDRSTFTPEMAQRLAEIEAEIEARAAEEKRLIEDPNRTEPWNHEAYDQFLESATNERNDLRAAKQAQDQKNAETKPVSGKAIWQKLTKMPGVKKEELEWTGLEDFLTAGDKYTRQQVLNFIEENGVVLEETVATEAEEDRVDELEWDAGEVWDDPEAWMHNVEDMLYEYDQGTVDDILFLGDIDENFMDEWLIENIDTVVDNYNLPDDQTEEIELLASADRKLDWLRENADADPGQEMRQQARDDFEERASEIAADLYMQDPQYIYATQGNSSNVELYIFGNDDTGYSIREDGWERHENDVGLGEIYSLQEAQIQAEQYARENELIEFVSSDDDQDVAKWEDYVEGDFDNYREVKIKLPTDRQFKGEYKDYYNEVHFPDPNIIAFLRVTDRTLVEDSRDDAMHADGIPKAYFVDEFQSDWHQEGRQKGYVDPGVDQKALIDDIDRIQMAVESDFKFAFDAESKDPGPGAIYEHASEVEARKFVVPVEAGGPIDGFEITRRSFVEYAWNIMRGSNEAKTALSGEELVPVSRNTEAAYRFVNDALNRHIDETDQDALRRGVKKFDESDRTLDQQRRGVPDVPFKGDAWISLGLKRALIQAVDDGYSHFAWADAEVLKNRWSDRYAKLYEMQYDKKMPSIVKKLTKQKPVHLRSDGTPKVDEVDTAGWVATVDEEARTHGNDDWYTVSNADGGLMQGTFAESAEQAIERAASNQLDHLKAQPGYWMIEIDEALADRIRDEGLPMFQEGGKKPRGFFDPDTNRITLTERANLSTFLHESGHFFLNVMRDLAEHDQSIQNDLSKLETWFIDQGAKDDRARHEMFASGFETYLQEGNAPVPELQAMFARFRSWLVMVYKQIGEAFRRNKLAGVELSDEVRGVMDRLVASQEAIDSVNRDSPVGPLPVEQLGLTPIEARGYQEIVDAGNDEANAQLAATVMRESQREREKWWRDSVAEKSIEIDAEMAQLPAYRARDFLSGDVVPDGVEAAKLDRGYVKDIYGSQAARKLQRMTSTDGVNPDVLATHFGFRNGDEMIRSLLATMNKGERAAHVKKMAEAQMRAEHGEIATDGSIGDHAAEAVANDKQAERLLYELKILNRSAGRENTPRQFFKAAAERTMADTPVDKIRPDIHRRNEIKARGAAVRKAAEGDFNGAALEQHRAVRQFYLYREALRMKRQTDGDQRRMMQMKKTKYSARRVDANYLQMMKVLLAAYDLRKNPKDSNARLDSVRKFIAAQRDTNPDLIADSLIDQVRSWKSMTPIELRAVRDAAENLLKIGKDNSEVANDEYRKQVNDLTASIEDKTDEPRVTQTTHSMVSRAKKFRDQFGAVHRKFESIIQELDGWVDNGPMAEAIFKPLWEAQLNEIDRMKAEHVEMNALFEGHDDLFSAFKDNLQDVDVTRKFVDLHVMPHSHGEKAMSRGERIVLALNMGNEGNREALRNQDGMGFTDEAMTAAIETLTPDELNLVNRIWEYVDKFYPELAKVEQQATGVAPQKVDATPFVANGVTMRGGYWPLQADSSLSWKAEMHDAAQRAEKLMMGGKARATTKHGSTHERVGFGGQIVDLSIDSLFKHVDGVVHDITHRRAVLDVSRLLKHPDIIAAGRTSVGAENYTALTDAVVRLAGGHAHPSDIPVLNRLMRYSRVVTSYGAMGYSARTFLINVTGLIPAIPEVGPMRLAGSMLKQLANPAKFGREIKARSTFMDNRGATITRDVFDVMRNLKGNTKWNWVKSHAFWMIVQMDAMVSRATWDAAYEKAVVAGKDEKDAIFDADRTVSRTQGTGLQIDLSTVEDQNEIFRALSPMYTYFNAILNLAKRQSGKRKTGQISNTEWLINMSLIFGVVPILEEIMFGHGDDDDETGETVERHVRAIGGYFVGQWFGVRELSGFIEYGRNFEPPLQRLVTAPPRAAGEYIDLIIDPDAEFDKQTLRATTDLLPVLGVPTGAQVNRMGRYLMEYEETGGEFDPYGFFVTGRNDPDD